MAKTILMLTVIALVPIVHDHERYEPGAELDIRESELPQLLEVNAVKLKEDAPATDAPAAAPAAKAKK